MNLNTNIVFQDKKDECHYVKFPDNFKIKKAKKINLRQSIPFKLGIKEIVQKKIKW